MAGDSFLGSFRRVLTKEEPSRTASAWTEQDLNLVESHLSRFCVCTTGSLRLTGEFSLKDGESSGVRWDHRTAMWRIFANQPHPEVGGGLFCLLELPHRITDESRIDTILNQLNQMEMVPADLPPHFGAWCQGNLDNNPTYVHVFPEYYALCRGYRRKRFYLGSTPRGVGERDLGLVWGVALRAPNDIFCDKLTKGLPF